MQAVLGDKNEPLFGSYREAPADHFPITEGRETVHKRNHFATVGFSSAQDGRVNMRVRIWPILRPGKEALPRSDTVFESALL
jgi:hypothetical protein